MKLPHWLRRTKPAPPAKTLRRCAKCGAGIHRHDRFRILVAVHVDCDDPKQTGQKSLETS